MTEPGELSILKDLQVVGYHSKRFLDSLRHRDKLADPAPYMSAGGLSHIDGQWKLIAYDIGPGPNAGRLWESTPPFERLMLGARTIHKWGHLAAYSGWVRVPEERNMDREVLTRAYEFQYLHLSRIENPMEWFMKSTTVTLRTSGPERVSLVTS